MAIENINALWETPPPETAVLLAPGPSVMRFNPSAHAADVVVGLNDCAWHFKCDFAVWVDWCVEKTLAGSLPAETTPIRPVGVAHNNWGESVWKKIRDGSKPNGRGYWWTIGDDIPAAIKYTAGVAFYSMARWGVKKIRMYGFDAWPTPKENERGKAPLPWLLGVPQDIHQSMRATGMLNHAVKMFPQIDVEWAHEPPGHRFTVDGAFPMPSPNPPRPMTSDELLAGLVAEIRPGMPLMVERMVDGKPERAPIASIRFDDITQEYVADVLQMNGDKQ